jgi:hypothetical protein
MYTPFGYRTNLGTSSLFDGNYLVVAGGGAGGVNAGGGGGAGGVSFGNAELVSATTYSVEVGAGAISDNYADCPPCVQYSMRRDSGGCPEGNPVWQYTNCINEATESITLSSLITRRIFSTTFPVKTAGCNTVGPTNEGVVRGDFCNPERTQFVVEEWEEQVGWNGPIQIAQYMDSDGTSGTIQIGYSGSPISRGYLSGSLVYTSMTNMSQSLQYISASDNASEYTASNSSIIGTNVNVVSIGGGNGESKVYGASKSGGSGGGGGIYIGTGSLGTTSQGNEGGDMFASSGSESENCETWDFAAGGFGGTASFEYCGQDFTSYIELGNNELIQLCINSGSQGLTGAGSSVGFVGYCSSSFAEFATGGGGGASEAGGTGVTGSAGDGGDGIAWLDGNYYGGGGAGIYFQSGSGSNGTGGIGGGGNPNTSGTSNTGGGGGGSYTSASLGGDGVVIVRYPGPIVLATGGTITQSGSFVYHTFTSGSHEFITTGSL